MAISSVFRTLLDRALRPVLQRFDRAEVRLANVERRLEQLQAAIGRVEARQLGYANSLNGPLSAHEFRAFSQWGEDGIIQWLVRSIEIARKVFVEFGVEDYSEANTRFLIERDNWTGLVLDSNKESIERLRESEICWRQGLHAAHALVTRDNINSLLLQNGISGEIGLLSIDIDGNDYWIWEAIEGVTPDIVVIEYNHRFGHELAVTIPYTENFQRGEQYPIYYFGASLRALCLLAERKGYAFVGCNADGVNAFFVRREKLGPSVQEVSTSDGFIPGKFTETRDDYGRFIQVSGEQERLELMRLPLIKIDETASKS